MRQILDLCGQNCPLPLLKTKKYLANIQHGDLVEVLTTDPSSITDIANFCAKTGNILVSQTTQNEVTTTVIRKKL